MKNYPSALVTFLQANRDMQRADLFTITLANGVTIHTTSWPTDLSLSGQVFSTRTFGAWKRGTVTMAATYDATPEEMELTVVCDSSVLFPGTSTPLLQTVASNIFDKSRVKVQTAYLPLNFNSIGAAVPVVDPNSVGTKFLGDIITSAEPLTSTSATFKVSDLTYLLQEPWPRKMVQSGCSNTVYDKNCGLNPASFSVSKTVAGGSTALVLVLNSALAQAAPYYDKGYVTFTSGQNAGLSMAIAKQLSSTQLQLSAPFLLPIFPGDALNIVPGCDGLQATCTTKFSNASKFQGMPFTPEPAKAISQ